MPFDRGPNLYKKGIDRLKPAVGLPSASDALLESLMASQSTTYPPGPGKPPAMPSDEEAAITWARLYHTQATKKHRTQFIQNAERYVRKKDGSVPTTREAKKYLNTVTAIVEDALDVFTGNDGRTMDSGVDRDVMRALMLRFGAHESAGGKLKRNIAKKGQKASNARGIWQVMPATVRALAKGKGKRAYIGPKAIQHINESLQQTDIDNLSDVIEDVPEESGSILLSKKDISNLSTRQINELMVNNDAINAVFATGALIMQAKDKKELWRLRKR